jgi:hypothetical protein
MKKTLVTLALFAGLNFEGFSQSNNFVAQGNYYKAKELYEKGNFIEALKYIKDSKELLGGTNERLQYLHIKTLFNLKQYLDANNELKIFFDIEDNKISEKYYSKNVEKLTSDETLDLTKMIVDIQEKSSYEISPKGKKDELAKEISNWINGNINTYFLLTSKTKGQGNWKYNNFDQETRFSISESNKNVRVYETHDIIADFGVGNTFFKKSWDITFGFENIDSVGEVYARRDPLTQKTYSAIDIFLHNSVTEFIEDWNINTKDTKYNQENVTKLFLPVYQTCSSNDISKFKNLIKKFKKIK